MENDNGRAKTAGIYLLRGTAVFAIFFFARFIIFVLTMNVALDKDTQIYADFPLWSVGLVVVLGSLLLYNSLVRHFSLYDARMRDKYLEKLDTGKRFAEYRRIIVMPEFLLETGIAMALLALFVPFGVFYEAEHLFSFAGGARYLFIYLVYLPWIFLSGLNARYETRRHWRQLYETHDIESLNKRWKFILKGVLFLLLYSVAVPLSPVLVFFLFNVYTVLCAILGLFSLVGITVLVLLLIFFILALPKIRALGVRRKFISRLRTISERSDYELFDLKKEKSLRLGLAGGLTFSLKYKEKLYSCRLIPIEKKKLPLYFTSENGAHFLYKLGGKKHFVSLAKHFEYSISGEGKHLIILAPEPKYVFVSSDGGEKRLFTGDKLWHSTVFEGDSFFGAMDRHCLDKSNGMFE